MFGLVDGYVEVIVGAAGIEAIKSPPPRWIAIKNGLSYRLLDTTTGRVFGRFATRRAAFALADRISYPVVRLPPDEKEALA